MRAAQEHSRAAAASAWSLATSWVVYGASGPVRCGWAAFGSHGAWTVTIGPMRRRTER